MKPSKKPSKKNDKKEINIIRVWRAVQQDAEGGDSNGRESRERHNFKLMLHKERQKAEDRRERERRECNEGGARDQREYEQKREAERSKTQAEVRQSQKEFNAALLAKLFDKK